jgi:hypothetical protein
MIGDVGVKRISNTISKVSMRIMLTTPLRRVRLAMRYRKKFTDFHEGVSQPTRLIEQSARAYL